MFLWNTHAGKENLKKIELINNFKNANLNYIYQNVYNIDKRNILYIHNDVLWRSKFLMQEKNFHKFWLNTPCGHRKRTSWLFGWMGQMLFQKTVNAKFLPLDVNLLF